MREGGESENCCVQKTQPKKLSYSRLAPFGLDWRARRIVRTLASSLLKRAKEKGKTKGIKNQIKKIRKDNKMLSQESGKRREKLKSTVTKKKEPCINGRSQSSLSKVQSCKFQHVLERKSWAGNQMSPLFTLGTT
jgi:hypothetical protein